MVLVRPLCARPGEGEQRSRTCRRFCLKKRWDTLGEPLSMEHGCHCGVGLSMFLGLQQRHRRGTIFGTSECANTIPSFSSAAFPVDPRIDVSCTLATGTPFGAGERLQRSIYRYRYCDLSDVPPVWHITDPMVTKRYSDLGNPEHPTRSIATRGPLHVWYAPRLCSPGYFAVALRREGVYR
jgi:hypothetical protein